VAHRIFLLSPAYCGGLRAMMVMRERATFPLARRLREPVGAPIGELFTFMSGLYFRGKLAYAQVFARPPEGVPGVQVITPVAGLIPVDELVTLAQLRKFAEIDIDEDDPRYRRPLHSAVTSLVRAIPSDCEVVLLGSIATGKYVDVLLRLLGKRLTFPVDFVGRGDMSRGGLMLRCSRTGEELVYGPVEGAVRHGKRPPKLPRLPRRATSQLGGS
jgi:hypothetical protein